MLFLFQACLSAHLLVGYVISVVLLSDRFLNATLENASPQNVEDRHYSTSRLDPRLRYSPAMGHSGLLVIKTQASLPLREPMHRDPSANRRPWLLGLDMLRESRQHAERHAYLDLLQHRFEINGNTFQSRRIGARRLATIDPANIETIVKHKAADYIVRPAREGLLGGLVGHGILTADGPLWKRHRAMMKPSFYKKRLEDFRVHEQHFQRLLACIPGDDGAVVDLKTLFFDFTINTSTAHLFGYSAGMLGSNGSAADGPELANAFDRAQRACVRKFALGWMDVFMPQLQYKRDTERIRAFTDRYIEQARESVRTANAQGGDCEKSRSGYQTPQNVLLDLISSIDDPEELRAVLLNLMVAGRDTTASLLSSLWHGISRDPEVWSKLQVEVASLGGEEPTAESIKRLPFLRQCIDEGQ